MLLELSVELTLVFLQLVDSVLETIIVGAHLLNVFPQSLNLFLSQAEQVLVTLQLQVALAFQLLIFMHLSLEQLLLVLQFVLNAFNVKLELLLNLYMIPDFSLVLLKHGLVLTGSLIPTYHTLRLLSIPRQIVSFRIFSFALTDRFASTSFGASTHFLLLMLFHFHIHEDLD